MSANNDNQLNQHLDQQQQQGADQQVDEQQQVGEEEVTDLQLEEAAQLGHVELLERVPLQRLVDFEHSRGSKRGECLLEQATKHGQSGVVQCLVRRSVESGRDFVRGWTVGHAAAFAGDLEALQHLRPDELSARSATGSVLLHTAALNGHVAAIDRLVELGVDPKATRNDGATTIHAAALNGHVAAIDRLVELEVDPKATNNDGWTTIQAAAWNGHVAAIDKLAELGVAPKATNNDGWTTIHAAAENGHVAAIDRLAELEVDPKATDNGGWTSIHAAVDNGHVAVIDRLVELEVDPKATRKDGLTAIHAAAWSGHMAAIDRLVELGVDPKATDYDGWTTIHAAAADGHVAAINRLVELEVDPKATDNDGYTTIHAAALGGHVAAIDGLVELGVDPKATRKDGLTAIHAAAWSGHVAAIDRLVELGVDPKATDNGGWTTIHAAAWNGHVAAIDRLVQLGVDPKATDNDGWTTIHAAAANGHVAVIDRLVELEVDPKATRKDGLTTIHSAAANGHVAAIDRLVDLGVDANAAANDGGDMHPLEQVSRLSTEFGAVVALAALDSVDSSRLDQVLAVWPQLQSLEVLCLRGLVAADFARLADRLSELSGLRRLFLGGVEGETLHVSASQLVAIASLPLTALELSHVSFEDATALRDCTSLASLKLSSCSLSSGDLDAIASLPQLQRLDLRRARFPSLDALVGGCVALRSLDVRDCGLTSAPAILASLPRLQQLFVLGNAFVDELREYDELFHDATGTVELLHAQSLSSESKTRDVPVVMVGHGRAGKSQVIRALLHEPQAEQGAVEHVELVTERTSMVESGIHRLPMSPIHRGFGIVHEPDMDEFEARFFDTPGQMEFFASNMAVIAPLFSNSVVLVVARSVPHGVDGAGTSLVAEKKRIASEFRLWLAEVSRAVVAAALGNGADAAGKSAKVLLVLTHRDVFEKAHSKPVVEDVVAWLDSLGSELRDEFSETLEVQRRVNFVNSTVASKRGRGVAPLRKRLRMVVCNVFVSAPLLPGVLVDARALVVSEEVRRQRVCEVETLEELLTSKFAERGLTLRLVRRLIGVLATNGSVLRTPGRQLVVVDPDWISRVMSSLYVDPKLHDAVNFNGDPSEFDALAAFDEDGEVGAADLEKHLRGFVDGDDALLERLLLVLVSNGIVIPLRVRPDHKGVPVVESYLIVGRWMDTRDGDGCVQWSSSRQDEASWFELVTGRPYSLQNAASAFSLAPSLPRDERPSFHLVSLRCETRVPLGPSFLTRLVHRLTQLFHSSRHSFLVRRTDFACVLPFTRFHATLHVRLPSSANAFELTLVAERNDIEAALQFVLRECVFHVLRMLALGEHDVWLRVKQRCSACVATREDLMSHARHDRELESGEAVRNNAEAVRALCNEVMGDGHNWQYDECRGRDGALSIEVKLVNPKQQSSSFGDGFVPDISPTSIKLNKSQVLGSGQFASVLMGEYNGTEVVLKELKVSSPDALAAFEREAELLGRASRHPRISLLLGMYRMSESQVYLVMERAGVCDLEKALCKPPEKPLLGATWAEFGVLVGLLKDVADGLRHMHSQDPPIVHNDVALRNVLVRHEDGRNRAKLTDMGLARAAPRGRVHELAPGTRVPKWQMAPETLESRLVSPASDVFQFGNLVYEMLARQRPFWCEWNTPGSKEECEVVRAAVVDDIKNGERPAREDVGDAGAHCDEALWQLAEECWHDDPLLRPSMAEMSRRLAKLIHERGGVRDIQAPLGQRSAATQGPCCPKLAPQPVDDDDDDDDDEAKQPDSTDEAENPVQDTSPPAPPTISTLPPPARVSDWAVDDVCTWLLNLPSAACAELAPLFRHQGVKGTVLLALEIDDLTELDIPRMTAKVLLQARDELFSPPE